MPEGESEKPSWKKSTLSQILVVACAAYVFEAIAVGCIGAWRNNLGMVSASMNQINSLIVVLLPIYGVRKGIEAVKNKT